MKKTLLTIALATAAVFGASAQSYLLDNPANKPYFGIRASGELTCPGKVKVGSVEAKDFKHGGGFEVGAVYNIPVVANFNIEPGVSFYYDATGLKNDKGYQHASMRESGLRVPVMLGYHFDFANDLNMNIFTGPELQVGLSNDMYTTTDEIAGLSIHHAPSNYGDNTVFPMNRVGCNWKFGVGFNISKSYYVGISGAVGLTNMSKIDNVHFKQNRVDFTLGYNF